MSDLESKIRHLEMVQAVIARLAQNSFLIKGWSVFTGSALFGFAVQADNWLIALLGSFAVCVFWVLDAYFLQREKVYRMLYEYVQRSDSTIEQFSLRYQDVPRAERPSIQAVAWSFTVGTLHGSIVVVGLLVATAIAC